VNIGFFALTMFSL